MYLKASWQWRRPIARCELGRPIGGLSSRISTKIVRSLSPLQHFGHRGWIGSAQITPRSAGTSQIAPNMAKFGMHTSLTTVRQIPDQSLAPIPRIEAENVTNHNRKRVG